MDLPNCLKGNHLIPAHYTYPISLCQQHSPLLQVSLQADTHPPGQSAAGWRWQWRGSSTTCHGPASGQWGGLQHHGANWGQGRAEERVEFYYGAGSRMEGPGLRKGIYREEQADEQRGTTVTSSFLFSRKHYGHGQTCQRGLISASNG